MKKVKVYWDDDTLVAEFEIPESQDLICRARALRQRLREDEPGLFTPGESKDLRVILDLVVGLLLDRRDAP
jgi:hypothetical protein